MQAKSDVYKAAEDRLVVNKYDLDAWNVLIKDHQVLSLLSSPDLVLTLFLPFTADWFNGI